MPPHEYLDRVAREMGGLEPRDVYGDNPDGGNPDMSTSSKQIENLIRRLNEANARVTELEAALREIAESYDQSVDGYHMVLIARAGLEELPGKGVNP